MISTVEESFSLYNFSAFWKVAAVTGFFQLNPFHVTAKFWLPQRIKSWSWRGGEEVQTLGYERYLRMTATRCHKYHICLWWDFYKCSSNCFVEVHGTLGSMIFIWLRNRGKLIPLDARLILECNLYIFKCLYF